VRKIITICFRYLTVTSNSEKAVWKGKTTILDAIKRILEEQEERKLRNY